MKFRTFLQESKITKDSLIAYDITDPTGIYKIGKGFQGKEPFKNDVDAKLSFGKETEDISVMKIKDFEKKFKTKIL